MKRLAKAIDAGSCLQLTTYALRQVVVPPDDQPQTNFPDSPGCPQKWIPLGSQQLEAVAAELQIASINACAKVSSGACSCVGKFVKIEMEKPSSVKTPLKDV